MTLQNMKELDYNTRILVSQSNYDFEKDTRILIPFQIGTKFGFINKNKQVVIPPTFDIILDDFHNERSLVRVGKFTAKAYERKTASPSASIIPIFGLLKADGTFLVPIEYEGISNPLFSNCYTLRSLAKGYSVIDFQGNEIVPFGKYNYIDGFDTGLARVKIGTTTNGLADSGSLWGIIDEGGNENLKPIYANIWNFYDKNRTFTKVVQTDGKEFEFHFRDRSLKYSGYQRDKDKEFEQGLRNYQSLKEYRESTYEEFNGSYAQDVMGYSDQDINDAFDGDPDAYWNID